MCAYGIYLGMKGGHNLTALVPTYVLQCTWGVLGPFEKEAAVSIKDSRTILGTSYSQYSG